jgi:head-tail adaptor
VARSDPYGSISSGELRHQVKIYRNLVTRSPMGAELTVPMLVRPTAVWVRIEPLQGQERFVAQQIFPEANALIMMRGILARELNLDVKMWIVFRDVRRYDIVDISDVDERYRETRITCIERPIGRNV